MTDKEQLTKLLDKFNIAYKENTFEYGRCAGKPYIYIEGCGCYHIFTFEEHLNGGMFLEHELSE